MKRRRAAPRSTATKALPPRGLEMMVGAAPEAPAALEVVEVRDVYQIQRGAHVFVTVNVDAAQLGEVSLTVNQTKIGDFTAPVASRDLGAGDDLLDKLLRVEAIVSDVMNRSDALKIRVTLTGGPSPKTIPASTDAGESGGSAKFRIFVLLRE